MTIKRQQIIDGLILLAIVAWGLAFTSFFPAAQIESAALFQPHHPSGAYTRPIEVKGAVRYITPEQKRRHDLFHTISLGGWIAALLTGLVLCRLEKKDSNPAPSN